MKDSGIPWIGEIPEGWSVEKGKHALNLQSRSPENYNEGVVTCFRDGEVTLRSNRRTEGFTFADKEIGYQGIEKGDLVIHGMDGFAGSIGISDSRGKGSPVLIVCRGTAISVIQYVLYYLRNLAEQKIFLSLATGIRERSCDLRWKKIKELPVLLPPSKTQQAIANFLDRKTQQIDATVEREKQHIEKLKQYRQSLISETVTKGLDPSVPMRDSGIPWIGKIPEGWEVCKLKYFTSKIGSGKTPKGGSEVYTNEGIYFLRSQNIHFSGLNLNEIKYISSAIDDSMLSTRVMKNDVLLNITGGSIGRCCIYNLHEKANVNQHVCIIRSVKNYLEPSFNCYFWTSDAGKSSINIYQSGANREGMNFEEISNTMIPFPPLPEQQAIADYLDRKTAQIDAVLAKKEMLIAKLLEYKKSLIYEAVTGRLAIEIND